MTEREWEEPLEELWAARRRIMAEFGGDRHRYIQHLMELQEQYRDRLITAPEIPGEEKKPAA